MLIRGDNRFSRLDVCLAAANQFLLSDADARATIDNQIDTIHRHWNGLCEEAGLSAVDKALLWQRQFLNPFALEASWARSGLAR
jgi:serine/threonine-protein kinase HipA